ncbi:MAG: transposase [Proteobacteria bacterium]|nr:transposase [Pseudomonadota bacterium]MBU1715025.1 transposase [Pseudomonadota bacterium]
MGKINEIFRTFGPEYIALHPDLSTNQRKVIDAIINCRTGEYGATVYRCEGCGEMHVIDRSCGNRHCPQCQLHKTRQWLHGQLARTLPTDYFMITFTVAKALRPFCLSHQKEAYGAMFRAAAGAIKKLAADPKYIGADLAGFTGVLHTWGRAIPYHPHLHFIVPAGGLDKNREHWLPAGNRFYLPVRALSKIFRAKLHDEIEELGLLNATEPEAWNTDWVVHCQPTGNAQAVLKYLAPYIFRVAISDKRIVAVRDREVTFTYTKVGSNRKRKMTVDALEFIRRFLLHVLPTGFMKVRHFGFMNHNCTIPLEKIRTMIIVQRKDMAFLLADRNQGQPPERFKPVCQACGANLVFLFSIIPVKPSRFAREGPE